MRRSTLVWFRPFLDKLSHSPWPRTVIHADEPQLSMFIKEVLESTQIPYQKECKLLLPTPELQGQKIWVNNSFYTWVIADYRVNSTAIELKANGYYSSLLGMAQGLDQISVYLECPGITDALLIYCNNLNKKLEIYVACRQGKAPRLYKTISIISPRGTSVVKKHWGRKEKTPTKP